MTRITASVGDGGVNNDNDVLAIKRLLNANLHLLYPVVRLELTPDVDEATIHAIRVFQRRVALFDMPDGRIDIDGQTLQTLDRTARETPPEKLPSFRFPLNNPPLAPINSGRQFGAPRAGRKHAACDLLANPGDHVIAMEDGVVTESKYLFFEDTFAFEVRHKGGAVVRYCEIAETSPGVVAGATVKKGDKLATIAENGEGGSMLHLEMYAGDAEGGLTDTSRLPYKRRSDLMNPTDLLQFTLVQLPVPVAVP